MTNSRSLETLTAMDFLDVKGSRFELSVPGHHDFQLELAEVTPAGGSRSGGVREPFAVVFHGPIEPVLPQAIYRLEHATLGVLELFIVPIGPGEPDGGPATMRYEAVFG